MSYILPSEKENLAIRFRKVQERVRFILEHYPQSRENDLYLQWLYWRLFDGISLPWLDFDLFYKMTTAETITRRRRELNEEGLFLPSSPVLEHREQMARHGKIKTTTDEERMLPVRT